MTDPWLVDALAEVRRIAALPDADAYPALQAYLDRWQEEPDGSPTMGDLLGDPDWERRELRKAMILLRAALGKEIEGGAKILTWHANRFKEEADRLQRDYPMAWAEVESEGAQLVLDATERALALEAAASALPRRRTR